MKLTNVQILNPQFVPALEKLLKKSMSVSTCEALAVAISEIEKKGSILQRVRTAMVDKYLEKDAKGKPVIINENQPKYKSTEAKQQFLTELNELLQGSFEVAFDKKIDVSEDEVMPAQEYMLIRDLVNIVKKSTGALDISK
jgi:signal transduction histidine kinase